MSEALREKTYEDRYKMEKRVKAIGETKKGTERKTNKRGKNEPTGKDVESKQDRQAKEKDGNRMHKIEI
jgi:hypothetical protein